MARLLIGSCCFHFCTENLKKIVFLKLSHLNILNLSRHHDNMERSILKFDSENYDPLINKKVAKFEEKIFYCF